MPSKPYRNKLPDIKNWIKSKTGNNPYGCMIYYNGAVIAEWYSGIINSESLFEIGSIRKSFNSALIGLAIEDGLSDINMKASSVWPEIAETSGEEKDREITLHHLASGTSGWLTPDPPGKKFLYNNAGFTASEMVVARIYGAPNDRIASEVIKRFKIPLQANSWEIYHFPTIFDPADFEVPGPKLAINSNLKDLLKWGKLWLDKGLWQGISLIPKQWVDKATRAANPEIEGAYYGFNWYINMNNALWPEAPADSFGHPGFGTFMKTGKESRTYLWICPSLSIVAAIVSEISAGFATDHLDVPNTITAELIGRIVKLVG